MQLTGYTNKLSVKPGETIEFYVSSKNPNYKAELVRIIHGDPNPKGPGFKTDFSQFKKKHNNFNFIKNADMGKEIEKADLVLSACGTTVYESMYLKW